MLEDGGGQEQNVAWTNRNGRRVIYERVAFFHSFITKQQDM